MISMYIFTKLDPPPTCGHGWVAYNRSCYKMFGNRKSWSAAQRACRDTGGHLVRIDNDGEQRFLASIARPKNWVCISFVF